ncbi:MAG: Uncharacterized protein JWR12_3021 [Mucilaginibacter sp.]|nr:Uncharacterized protein [Mucilaginibacter sp.]
MIFLSAQPDTLYSKWQLEVQLFNFKKHGIDPVEIHVLIGYDPAAGINSKFCELFETHRDYASFFIYEDNRSNKSYVSSIRPHIIKQHFLENPFLNDTCVFYHDSDIIFRELPDFKTMCIGEHWQLSDTRHYIGAEWIKKTGRNVLEEMCLVTGKNQRLIEQNDLNSGGAQYLMKNVNYQFWHMVERDCQRLYDHLQLHQARYAKIYMEETGNDENDYKGVLAWCADMWAVLWNAFELGYKTQINSQLDFCWPKDELTCWDKTSILHNAGLDEKDAHNYFYKGDFKNTTPYQISLDYVLKDSCSQKYVEAIQESRAVFKRDLSDVTFLIPIRIDTNDRLQNLYTIINYIDRNFKTNIILLEADKKEVVDKTLLPSIVRSIFIKDDDYWFHRTKYNNQMIKEAKTSIIALYDADVIVEVNEIWNAVKLLRNNVCKIALPYDGTFISVYNRDQINIFAKNLDIKVLKAPGISIINKHTSCGGAVFVNKSMYIQCGMENEKFHKWGPEDIERVRRLEILGHPFVKTEGKLYHLDHEITANSGYTSTEEYLELMRVHLNVIQMDELELKSHIEKWVE